MRRGERKEERGGKGELSRAAKKGEEKERRGVGRKGEGMTRGKAEEGITNEGGHG